MKHLFLISTLLITLNACSSMPFSQSKYYHYYADVNKSSVFMDHKDTRKCFNEFNNEDFCLKIFNEVQTLGTL